MHCPGRPPEVRYRGEIFKVSIKFQMFHLCSNSGNWLLILSVNCTLSCYKMEEKVYCLCRRPYEEDEFMIQCDVCNDWFHGRFAYRLYSLL